MINLQGWYVKVYCILGIFLQGWSWHQMAAEICPVLSKSPSLNPKTENKKEEKLT